MKAADRDARQMRWAVWHNAALPLLKRFPTARTFIDPGGKTPEAKSAAAKTFMALRRFSGETPPAWVLERFGIKEPT